MKTRYKVGDRVRVTNTKDPLFETYIGSVGTIRQIYKDRDYSYPLNIVFDNDLPSSRWKEDEIAPPREETIKKLLKLLENESR